MTPQPTPSAGRLPADVARCGGLELITGHLAPQCVDCRRRTDRSHFPIQVWMGPPISLTTELCARRIAP